MNILFFLLCLPVFATTTESELALNWKPEPEFGGFYQAELAGNYKKHGLKVKIIPGGAGQPVAQLIAAKKVEFGIVGADDLILARQNGAKIVAVFAVYQVDPHGFMVHPKRKIEHLKDLFASEGEIALEKGLPYTAWLEKKYGPFKAKIVPYTGGVGEFIRNDKYSQQCFVFSEPIAARRLGMPADVLLVAESGFNPYLTVVAVHEDTLKNKPAIVKNFVKATREGWIRYLSQPTTTNAAMQKLNNSMDLESFNQASVAQLSFIQTEWTKKNGLGTMEEKRWTELEQQLFELGLLKTKAKSSDYFRNY